MLRRTMTILKVNPYILFLSELGKAGKLEGIRAPGKFAGQQYRKLNASQKSALVARAKVAKSPKLEAYRAMAKREMARKNVPIEKRVEELKRKWSAAKAAQKQSAPKPAAKSAKAKPAPKSAKSKVKKAAKKNKA